MLSSLAIARSTISVVLPAFNEEGNLEHVVDRVARVLMAIDVEWEILIVDDGSIDRTLAVAEELHYRDQRIKAISLSRNFGKEIAVVAGLRGVSGNAAIVMDADLQHPPELITKLIERWRQGYDVVYAERKHSGRRFFSKAFYKVFRLLTGTTVPDGAGDFRLLNRNVIDAFNLLNERARYNNAIWSWLGFSSTSVPCDIKPRHKGSSTFNFRKKMIFGGDAITSFSTVPLTIWSYVGVAISICALIYALRFFVATLLWGTDAPGFPSLIISVMFFAGIQLISLGVLGKYIGKIYDETKGRPLYLVNTAIGMDGNVHPRQAVSSPKFETVEVRKRVGNGGELVVPLVRL